MGRMVMFSRPSSCRSIKGHALLETSLSLGTPAAGLFRDSVGNLSSQHSSRRSNDLVGNIFSGGVLLCRSFLLCSLAVFRMLFLICSQCRPFVTTDSYLRRTDGPEEPLIVSFAPA